MRRVPRSLFDGPPEQQHVDAFQCRHLPDPQHSRHLVVFTAKVQTVWAERHGSNAYLGVRLTVTGSLGG